VVNSSTMNFDGFTYSGVVYDATADRNVKLFIWERASGSSGADLTTDRSQFMVVNKVYKKLNKDNEIVTVVDGFYDRLPVEYVVSEKCVASNGEAAVLVDHDALDLQFGDVIHASLDGGGRMQGFKRVFTLDEREGNLSPFNKGIFGCAGWNVSIATPYSAASVGDSNLGSLGNWASVHIDPVRVMGNNMLVNAHTGLVDSLIAPYGYNSVLVVDEASKTIRTGSPAADVMPYDENQTVLLQMMNGRYQHLIIINHEPDVEYASWMYEPFTTAELNSAGLPYHVGGAERWSADGAVLNYALVANPADATDTVLKITNGSEQNNSMNMVVTDVAKPTQNPMAFSLRFRLYIDEFTNDAGASFRIGNSANSVSIHDGALWLRTGAGESKILDYTTDTWYEL